MSGANRLRIAAVIIAGDHMTYQRAISEVVESIIAFSIRALALLVGAYGYDRRPLTST